MYNNGGQDFGYTRNFTAQNIRPEPIPHHANPPIYEQYITLDTGNPELRKQPRFKFWIHQPTTQFPETACFISLSSGGRSSFSRITRDSLTELALWLGEVLEHSSEIFDASVLAESEFSASVNQANELQSRIATRLQSLRDESKDKPRGKRKESKSEGDNTGES
jgi:hypothetical protein